MYNEIKNIIEMEKYYTNIKCNVICECGNKKKYTVNQDGYIICPRCGLIQHDINTPNNLMFDILQAQKKQHKEHIKYMKWLNSTL